MLRGEEISLVQQMLGGNDSAFSVIFRTYYVDLVLFAGTFVRDRQQAEEIVQDGKGNYWFLYHAIEKKYPNLGNGATRRPLMLDRLTWFEGWPMIEYSEPSIIKQEVPAIQSGILNNLN